VANAWIAATVPIVGIVRTAAIVETAVTEAIVGTAKADSRTGGMADVIAEDAGADLDATTISNNNRRRQSR